MTHIVVPYIIPYITPFKEFRTIAQLSKASRRPSKTGTQLLDEAELQVDKTKLLAPGPFLEGLGLRGMYIYIFTYRRIGLKVWCLRFRGLRLQVGVGVSSRRFLVVRGFGL